MSQSNPARLLTPQLWRAVTCDRRLPPYTKVQYLLMGNNPFFSSFARLTVAQKERTLPFQLFQLILAYFS
jgi:hypothetical protein